MEISHQLAPLVLYDDYDTRGFVLDIKQNILVELNERDTCMLSAILGNSTLTEVLQQIDGCVQSQLLDKVGEPDVLALLERLEEQKILEPQKNGVTSDPLCTDKHQHEEVQLAHFYAVTRRQRLIGGGYIVSLLAELCKGDEGLYRAHQYIWKLKELYPTKNISVASAVVLVREEYWFYRLVTGLIERRVAHIMGQIAGNEGFCLIRAFALCAYLLILGVPASVVIARPKYGACGGFKLHVWVEMQGTPLNERPNIGDGYRLLYIFPFSS